MMCSCPASRRAFVSFFMTVVISCGGSPSAQEPSQASLPPPGDRFCQDLSWSPDGKWIAFSEFGGTGDTRAWRIWMVRADGSDRRLLADSARWVDWSPDGARLVFASLRGGQSSIYLIDRDGSNPQELTQCEAGDSHPSWSPDGKHIAFTSDRDGMRAVFIVKADGSNPTRVSFGNGDDHNPRWSPDGGRVVFSRSVADGGGHDQIHIATVDGLAEYAITSDSLLNMYPSFINVREVAFSRRTGDSAFLVVADVAGQGRRRVGEAEAFFARWSPDRSRIAYIAGEWPQSSIYVMQADGSAAHRITN